jgi:glycyl-tRNA synthetase
MSEVQVAILPLMKKASLLDMSKEIEEELCKYWTVDYDDSKAVGHRYRHQDDIGTPYCVIIDFQSIEDNAVIVRGRDTKEQERIPVAELVKYLFEKFTQ